MKSTHRLLDPLDVTYIRLGVVTLRGNRILTTEKDTKSSRCPGGYVGHCRWVVD